MKSLRVEETQNTLIISTNIQEMLSSFVMFPAPQKKESPIFCIYKGMNISFLNALIFVAYIPRFYTLTVITDIVSIPIYRTFVGQYQSSGIDLREVVHQV